MALHWKRPTLARRVEPLGTMALHCWLYTVGSTRLALHGWLYRDVLEGKRPAVRFVEVTL